METPDAIKLSDTQRIVLAAAAARVNGSLLPMPDNVRGGASIKVLAALVKKGCAETVENPEEIGGTDYRITRTGLLAIGADPDEPGYEPCSGKERAGKLSDIATRLGDLRKSGADMAMVEKVVQAGDGTTGIDARGADVGTEQRLSDIIDREAKVKTRAGTKQARLIEMLSADGGATVEILMAEFGWQRHTVRGAISGAIKKKLGLTVEVIKDEDGERHYHIPA